MGFQGAILWITEAKYLLPRLKNQRRVLAVARKPLFFQEIVSFHQILDRCIFLRNY
ncbi:hypothetical protein ES703_124458 [subsurface metagenome]